MPTGKAQRKSFSEEEKESIIQFRSEGKSTDTIAAIMRVGKERVRRFLKENSLETYQNVRNRPNIDPASRQIVAEYPDFRNAACKGEPITRFYASPSNGSNKSKIKFIAEQKQTIEICAKCSVQEACLEYALKAEPYGIWGGTTESEREYLRVRLGIECERDVLISRNARRVIVDSRSPMYFSAVSVGFESSPIVKKRMLNPSRQENQDRASKILDLHFSGKSLSSIGAEFGISKQSVHEIIQKRTIRA